MLGAVPPLVKHGGQLAERVLWQELGAGALLEQGAGAAVGRGQQQQPAGGRHSETHSQSQGSQIVYSICSIHF